MPYNVERILLLAMNLNTQKVASIMEEFDATKATQIPPNVMKSVSKMITGWFCNIVQISVMYVPKKNTMYFARY